MKHILRKLHLGGNHEGGFDGRNNQAIGGLSTSENQESPVTSSSSSSSGRTGWLTNARHTFRPSSSSSSAASNNVSTPRRQTQSSQPSTSTANAENPSPQDQGNFNYYEEEYQVQLALALSVSNQNIAGDDPESLQIRAAKRISLGRPVSPGSTPAECVAHRYWSFNVLDYDEKVVDGFYDVYGVVSDFGTVEKIPSLVDLQSTPVTGMLGYEVVLVNRAVDPDLMHLEQASLCLAVNCGMNGISPQSSVLVQKIADLVVQHMGGPVVDANNMLRNWVKKSYELRTSINNIVLPLGCLKIGLSRHRALLFKVLADHVGIPCRLVKGSHYTGTDEGAVNIVKLESDREYIVDLMGAPGTLLPAEPIGTAANIDLFENTALVEEIFLQMDNAHDLLTGENRVKITATYSDESRGEPSNHSLMTSSQQQENGYLSVSGEWRNSKDTPEFPVIGCQSSKNTDEVEKSNPALFGLQTAVDVPLNLDEEWVFLRNPVDNNGGEDARKSSEAEIQILNIHERLNSGYMECWKKHVNNKGDPVLENVTEWEIPWEEIVIGERIGLGSYGEVHHGDWRGTEVAVKRFLDQDFFGDALDEFISEVRIMRRMQHPNVVLFLGAVTRPPNLSIVTEYLPRGSLFRLLHRPNCQLDEKLRLKMALDVAEGMNYLHTSNPIIVHRDLKSPNLLVDKNWVVKVCDFGLSRMKHHTFLSSKSTAGTPEWMAPEVLRNELSNEKCDVYSYGVILWELCTLQQPWTGMNPMQVVGAVGFQNRRLEIPRNVDPHVVQIISSCWQSEPRLRPSFSELTIALKPLERLLIND